jgi:CHAD domain-containing protein
MSAMARSRRKPGFPLLQYIDGLMARLHEHVPLALERFDADAIHDARVATRRLKAAVDLMKPVLTRSHRKPLADGLKRLRRRLGDLRDADVMLDHLGELAQGKHAAAANWLCGRLEKTREKLREKSRKEPSARRELRRVEGWAIVRHQIEEARDAVDSLLGESLHLQTDAFAEQAAWLTEDVLEDSLPPNGPLSRYSGGGLGWGSGREGAGESESNSEKPENLESTPQDDSSRPAPHGPHPSPPPEYRERENAQRPRQNPHDLRIAAKALRYTLEMADEEGRSPGVAVMRTFKRMQDQLGTWHDFVVLADRALCEAVDAELTHQDAAAAERVIELAKFAVRRSAQELAGFARMWGKQGAKLVEKIRTRFPLSTNVFTAPETGPGPSDSAPPEAPAAAAPAESPAA